MSEACVSNRAGPAAGSPGGDGASLARSFSRSASSCSGSLTVVGFRRSGSRLAGIKASSAAFKSFYGDFEAHLAAGGGGDGGRGELVERVGRGQDQDFLFVRDREGAGGAQEAR